jgi:hypothetical protein
LGVYFQILSSENPTSGNFAKFFLRTRAVRNGLSYSSCLYINVGDIDSIIYDRLPLLNYWSPPHPRGAGGKAIIRNLTSPLLSLLGCINYEEYLTLVANRPYLLAHLTLNITKYVLCCVCIFYNCCVYFLRLYFLG